MNLDLTGKVAIITGGSDGIGRASAHRLALEGANVTICARGEDRLRYAAEAIGKDAPERILAVRGDVRSDEDVANVVAKTLERFGGIDILFNNAGSSNAHPFLDVDDKTWADDLDVKVYGAIRFSRAVIPHMLQRGGGRIVNVTTIGGKAPVAKSLPTSLSRAAGINLSKSLANEFAAAGILVNSICLGLVKSAYFEELHAQQETEAPLEAWYQQMGRSVPIGRLGEPEEVANLVAFLASPRAAFITGASINIDGGASPVT